jgi:hypothetical protein
VRELPADYVAGHVEPAYALTGHGMQGGTVEWAAVVAEPWELTRGWSYTALSRTRDATELHVIAPHDTDGEHRDEIAPSYRPPRATRTEILDRVAQRMTIRDDEDLAVDRLSEHDARSGAVDAADPNRGAPPNPAEAPPQPSGLSADRQHLAQLLREVDRLADARHAFPTGDLLRHAHAEDQLRKLDERRAAAVERLTQLPEPRKRLLRGAQDDHATERRVLQARIADADRHRPDLVARRDEIERRLPADPQTLRRELGDVNRELRDVRARAEGGLSVLGEQEVRTQPAWATRQLGPRPDDNVLAERWDEAARHVAEHALRHRPLETIDGLGSRRPDDPREARVWHRATRTVDDARRSIARGPEPPDVGFDLGR